MTTTVSTTLKRLKKLFLEMTENQADVNAIAPQDRLHEDLGFTSLNMLWMAFAIEQEFGIALREIDISRLSTVGDVCDYIDAAIMEK